GQRYDAAAAVMGWSRSRTALRAGEPALLVTGSAPFVFVYWRKERHPAALRGQPSDRDSSRGPGSGPGPLTDLLSHGATGKHMRATIISLLLTCTLALGMSRSEATTNPLGTQVARETLANGLRVVVVRDPLAPVVSTSVNYLVGSDEAPRGFPGMAHAQEHMMFRGSPGLTADQLADIGSIMGGNFNADTRESVTQYLFTVPAEDLDVALHIEAIRMGGVGDSAAQWKQERGAIEQEVAQDLSNPDYVLYEKMRAEMFAGTPYAHDALGTRPSFNATTAGMLQQFHDRWYAPNNAILVIAGDVDPKTKIGRASCR